VLTLSLHAEVLFLLEFPLRQLMKLRRLLFPSRQVDLTPLRGPGVHSNDELKSRIEAYPRVTEKPVVLRWKYKLETPLAA
jgi:hypothetical protein